MSAALQLVPSVRDLLRSAIARHDQATEALNNLNARHVSLAADEATARNALGELHEAQRQAWAAWAEDSSKPKPTDAGQRLAELNAMLARATKQREAFAFIYSEALERCLAEMTDSGAALDHAVSDCLLEVTDRIGQQYEKATRAALCSESALLGLKDFFITSRNSAGAKAAVRAMYGDDPGKMFQKKQALNAERLKLRQHYKNFGAVLLENPDASDTPDA